jgi:RHS repeat-associated protein
VAGVALTHAYAYDAAGNRTKLTQNGVVRTSTVNALNQLLSESNPAVSYAYDVHGNRVQRKAGTLTETLGYDFDARLASYTAGTTSASYAYNGLGERVKKTVGSVVTASYQDGPEVILEKQGSVTTFYLHGPGIDALLAKKTGTTWTYYHQDGLGSVAALTNSSGTVVQSYAYEPFGSVRKQTGTLANAWEFTGRPRDAESSLVFLRNRYYDSRTGSFITQDPIGPEGGVNLYAYVQNNPINLTDAWGYQGQSKETEISLGDMFFVGALILGAAAEPSPFGEGALLAGFTKHGINTIINRRISAAAIKQALTNPARIKTEIDALGRVSHVYIGKVATVVLNTAREVITAWPN